MSKNKDLYFEELVGKTEKSKEFRDARYNLESFLIDCSHFRKSEKQVLGDKDSKRARESMILSKQARQNFLTINEYLSEILTKLGIPQKLSGAKYLKYCICRKALDDDIQMMQLYEMCAKEYSKNVPVIEQSCRYACSYADFSNLSSLISGIRFLYGQVPTVKDTVFILSSVISEKFDIKNMTDGNFIF